MNHGENVHVGLMQIKQRAVAYRVTLVHYGGLRTKTNLKERRNNITADTENASKFEVKPNLKQRKANYFSKINIFNISLYINIKNTYIK